MKALVAAALHASGVLLSFFSNTPVRLCFARRWGFAFSMGYWFQWGFGVQSWVSWLWGLGEGGGLMVGCGACGPVMSSAWYSMVVIARGGLVVVMVPSMGW